MTKNYDDPSLRMFRTVSDEYKKILGRMKGWVDNGKILTEESPEIKEWRDILDANSETLTDITQVCVHLQKRKTILGVTEITFTQQGTLTERWAVDEVTRLIEKYLVIGGEGVKVGDLHENDNAASISNLRHYDPEHDRTPTVNLPKEIRAIRTSHSREDPLAFGLNNLTAQLPDLLEPIRRADQDLWLNEKHKVAILKVNLTPAFLAKQYSLAHQTELERLDYDRWAEKFHPNQATAFLINRNLKEAIKASIHNFVSSQPQPPVLHEESKKVVSQFTERQREEVRRNYFKKVRLFNLPLMTKHFSQFIELSGDLELYSESPEGIREGCNASQTEQHRKTKMKAINGFLEALEDGEIPEAEAKEAVNDMLTLANIKGPQEEAS